MDPSTFLNTIYPGAIQTFRFSGILPSITASQAILESDWGRSSLAQECHNLFGIKADPGWKVCPVLDAGGATRPRQPRLEPRHSPRQRSGKAAGGVLLPA